MVPLKTIVINECKNNFLLFVFNSPKVKIKCTVQFENILPFQTMKIQST